MTMVALKDNVLKHYHSALRKLSPLVGLKTSINKIDSCINFLQYNNQNYANNIMKKGCGHTLIKQKTCTQ